MTESTPSIYDRRAGDWSRHQPLLLSDYTARPRVLEVCNPQAGMRVLDLGCGEGYVARQFATRGASVLGMDISAGMIERASAVERDNPLGIEYRTVDASGALDIEDSAYDLCIAVFLFNYLTVEEMTSVMKTVQQSLRPEGRFVFTVPHPLLAYLRDKERPFYFDHGDAGYFSGRDKTFEGRIWRRDGIDVEVRCVHKTLGDYFDALRAAGFAAMPIVTELGVTEEHLELDPSFFGPLKEQPLHVMFELQR